MKLSLTWESRIITPGYYGQYTITTIQFQSPGISPSECHMLDSMEQDLSNSLRNLPPRHFGRERGRLSQTNYRQGYYKHFIESALRYLDGKATCVMKSFGPDS